MNKIFLTSLLNVKNDKDKGVIIVFKNKPKTPTKEIKRFCNRLYGYKDYSQNGEYLYERKGLLDEIPHILINPIRSVLIVKKENAEKTLEFLKVFDTETYTKDTILEKEELKKLKIIRRDEPFMQLLLETILNTLTITLLSTAFAKV